MSVATSLVARSSLSPPSVPLSRRRALLTVVPVGETAAPRAPFAAAIVALLVSGLIGLLILNTVLGKDAFRLHALQAEGRALADTEQALTREVESLRAPAALAEKAAALGMVQAGPPSFLRLPDGAVLGSALPAEMPLGPDGLPLPAPAGAVAEQAAASGETDAGTSAETAAETDTSAESGDEDDTTPEDG